MRRCAAIGACPSAILSGSRRRYEVVHGLTYTLALFERGGAAARPVLQTFSERRWLEPALAWYFVAVWGSGIIATKIGLQHAPPFTFLALRFAFGMACVVPIALIVRPRWPRSITDLRHVIIAGLLVHAVHLGGSHYTQFLGMSAGITAVLLSVQPLLTALIAARWMGEKLTTRQWTGIGV